MHPDPFGLSLPSTAQDDRKALTAQGEPVSVGALNASQTQHAVAVPRAEPVDLRRLHLPADRDQLCLRLHRRCRAVLEGPALRRLRKPGHAARLRQPLRPQHLQARSVLARRLEHGAVLAVPGHADGAVQPDHRAGAESQDRRPRLLARRVLLPGAALACRRRADLEVDPAARRPAQRRHGRARRRAGAVVGRSGTGVFLGRLRQHLGPHGLLHADPAGRPASDSGRPL